MAGPIRIAIVADAGKAISGLKGVGDEAEKLPSRLDKLKAGLGATLATAGAAGAAALGKGLADNLNIEAANSKLTAQLGLSKEASAKAGEIAGKVWGDNWGGSIDEVNAALKSVNDNVMSVSTSSAADIQSVTEKTLALAQAFNVDVADATRGVGQLMKTGLAKDSKEAFDVITAGFQSGLDSSGDWIDTLNEYSTQFRKLGLSGKDATSLISQGLKAGARDSDIVADAIKEFTLRTTGNLEQADAKGRLHLTALGSAFQSVGLDGEAMYKAQQALAQGGEPARAAFQKMLQGLNLISDPLEKQRTAVALFGTQAEDMGAALYALDLSKPAAGMENVAGATDRMADALGDNAQAKIETMKRGFEGWTQSLASTQGPLGDVTAGLLAFGAPALTLAGSVGQVVTALAAMNVAAVGSKVAQLASAAATGVWTAAQWLLNAALTANPIGLIIIAVAALVAGIVIAYQRSETFRNIVTGAFGKVRDAAVAAFNWVRQNWPLLLAIITGPIGVATLVVIRNWTTIKTAVSGVINAIKAFLGDVLTKATSVWNSVRTAAASAWANVSRAVSDKVSDILTSIRGIPGKVAAAFSNAGNLLYNAGARIISGLWDGLKAKWEDLKRWFSNITSQIPNLKGPPGKDRRLLQGAGQLVMAGFQDGLESQYSGVRSSLAGFTSTLSGAVSTTGIDGRVGAGAGAGGSVSIGTLQLSIPGGSWDLASREDRRAIAEALVREMRDALTGYEGGRR